MFNYKNILYLFISVNMTITFVVRLYGYNEIKCVMESNSEFDGHSVEMLKRIPVNGEYL